MMIVLNSLYNRHFTHKHVMHIVFKLLLVMFHAASPDPCACRAGETQATGDAHCDVH
jgi:hypothetical protein